MAWLRCWVMSVCPSPLQYFMHKRGMSDGFPLHVLCGTVAGAMATLIGNPIDVVKTRVMAAKKASGGGPSPYSGALDCIAKTMRNEGPLAFYQGVVPQFFRITGWNIVMFITFEQLKARAGSLLNPHPLE